MFSKNLGEYTCKGGNIVKSKKKELGSKFLSGKVCPIFKKLDAQGCKEESHGKIAKKKSL